MSKKNKLVYDVHERPSLGKWIILSIQHVFAMFGATVLVPILINSAIGSELLSIPVALFAAGLGTLIYIFLTKCKSPVFLGGSFAFIAPVIAAYQIGGKSAVFTGIMAVGITYIFIALLIKIFKKDWIEKLLPPIIVGPMIIIIGIGLGPAAIEQTGLNGTFDFKNILVALTSFLTAAMFMLRGKGFFKVVPVLVGIMAGYIVSIVFGMVDFREFVNAPLVGIPNFVLPFIDYNLNFAALFTLIPICLATLAEHVGDHTVLGTMINKDLLKDPGLDRTVLGDGLSTFISGLLGNTDTTTYGENISVVGMTKVASIWAVALASVISMALGFFTKLTSLITTIPTPVLGGISILLFGFISANGLRILVENKIDFYKSRNVIIASTMLIIGLGGAVLTITTDNFNLTMSGMSLAAIIGIILNLILPNELEDI